MIGKNTRFSPIQPCIYVMFSTFNTSAYKNNFYIIIFTRQLQLICIFLSKLCSKYTLKLIERQESLKTEKTAQCIQNLPHHPSKMQILKSHFYFFVERNNVLCFLRLQYIIQTDFKTKQKISLRYFSQTADEYKCGHWPNVHLTKKSFFEFLIIMKAFRFRDFQKVKLTGGKLDFSDIKFQNICRICQSCHK